jgi:hypothetical protein
LEAPPAAAAIASIAVISSFLMLVSPHSLMLCDRLLLIFEYTALGSMRAQASAGKTEVAQRDMALRTLRLPRREVCSGCHTSCDPV